MGYLAEILRTTEALLYVHTELPSSLLLWDTSWQKELRLGDTTIRETPRAHRGLVRPNRHRRLRGHSVSTVGGRLLDVVRRRGALLW